jgi:hypothetical protein
VIAAHRLDPPVVADRHVHAAEAEAQPAEALLDAHDPLPTLSRPFCALRIEL